MQDRLATINRLDRGAHQPDSQYCFMEAVAFVNGNSWSDSPKCACPVISAYARSLNDAMPDDERQRLIPYILSMIGSKAGPKIEQQRTFLLADLAIRVITPLALRSANLEQQAIKLEGLNPITDKESAESAESATRSAVYAAVYAAESAAKYAPESAPVSAAWSAAVSAKYAAESASWSAEPATRYAAVSAAVYAAKSAAVYAAESAPVSAGNVWDKAVEGLDKAFAITADTPCPAGNGG